VFINNGDGTFQAEQEYGVGLSGGGDGLAVGDFNGDGVPDLAVTRYLPNSVSVFLGNGNGSFQSATSYPVGAGIGAVAVGDFNGDGFSDLALTNNASQNGVVTALLNAADWNATEPTFGAKPRAAALDPSFRRSLFLDVGSALGVAHSAQEWQLSPLPATEKWYAAKRPSMPARSPDQFALSAPTRIGNPMRLVPHAQDMGMEVGNNPIHAGRT
jgi:hypothetical protein